MSQKSEKWYFLENATKKEIRSAIGNLKRSLTLFKNGARWVTGVEVIDPGRSVWREDKNGIEKELVFKDGAFCSVGAIRHIDGPGEELAAKTLAAVAAGSGSDLDIDKTWNGVEYTEITIDQFDINNAFADIASWNDDQLKFTPIKTKFNQAIAKLERELEKRAA